MINVLKLSIWGRAFSLPVEYDCYEGETIIPAQINALESFIAHEEWIINAKKQVEAYCRESVIEDDKNPKKDNIFSYIRPVSIFVKHDSIHPRVALMCDYRYDIEHGLAVVFSSEGKVTVGIQDIIL